MRIIYGVVGEGMGHATRSRVILEHLHSRGHDITVVVSGRAHAFLQQKLDGRERLRVKEIHGLHLKFDGNELDVPHSILSNLMGAPEGTLKNLAVVKELTSEDADVVISDFESVAWWLAKLKGLPLISIDNMQVLNRCRHDDFASDDESFAFRLAKFAVKSKLPGAYHYLVSSFFFPPVRKPRTTLIPPILRPEILAAQREPGAHVLVYQTAAENADALVQTLNALPQWQFLAYGTGKDATINNVVCKPFSETGFVDDLRTARCVIAGGGYSLMGEAVHLHVPMLSIPIGGQYEQELNARYLERLGYGRYAEHVDKDVISAFIDDAPTMQQALERYTPRNNTMLFTCIDELLGDIARGAAPKPALHCENLGSYADDVDDSAEFTDPALIRGGA